MIHEHPEGAARYRTSSGTLSGCELATPVNGGLRRASTTGYFLATLRVATVPAAGTSIEPPSLTVGLTQGQVGREFRLRSFLAGSIFTFWKVIEPLASTTSLASTPRKMQSAKCTSSMIAPGKLAIHITRGLEVLLTFSIFTLRTTGLYGPFGPVSYMKSIVRMASLTWPISTLRMKTFSANPPRRAFDLNRSARSRFGLSM